MRFLIAFAIFGCAAASSIYSPLVVGATAGDVQAAAIDANVAVQDNARAIGEGHARAAEAAVLYNTEAVRQVAETNRDIHENAYWNGVAASQNVVAAAQSQVAAIDGAAAAVRAGAVAAPLAYGYSAPLAYPGVLPVGLGYAGYGVHGIRAW